MQDKHPNMAFTRSQAKSQMLMNELTLSKIFDRKKKSIVQVPSLKELGLPNFLKSKQPLPFDETEKTSAVQQLEAPSDKVKARNEYTTELENSDTTKPERNSKDKGLSLFKSRFNTRSRKNASPDSGFRSSSEINSNSGSIYSVGSNGRPVSRSSTSSDTSASSECLAQLEERIYSTKEINKAFNFLETSLQTPEHTIKSVSAPSLKDIDSRLSEMNSMLKAMFETSQLLQTKIVNLESKYNDKPEYIKRLPKPKEQLSDNGYDYDINKMAVHFKNLNTIGLNKVVGSIEAQNRVDEKLLARIFNELNLCRDGNRIATDLVQVDQKVREISDTDLCDLIYSAVDAIPEIGALKQALVSKLPLRIPIRKFVVAELLQKQGKIAANFDNIFTVVDDSDFIISTHPDIDCEVVNKLSCSDVSLRFEAALTTSKICNLRGTEAFLQYTLDTILHAVFGTAVSFAGLPLKYDRNKIDVSLTKEGKRPDFVCWHNELLIFKGEEKKRGNVRTIALELTDKMKENKIGNNKGQLPFLLSYATAGSHILFVAIDEHNNMLDCSDILDMNSVADRVTILLILINTIRITRKIAEEF